MENAVSSCWERGARKKQAVRYRHGPPLAEAAGCFSVTDAIRQYVEEKISKAVANYAHNIKKIDVTISARGGDTGTHGAKQQKVDVTITTLKAGVVRVEDSEESLYASIDLVCDKVARKLRKVKERLMQQGAWPGKGGPRVNTEEEEFKEYMDSVIVEAFSFGEEEARAAEMAAPAAAAALPTEVVRSKVVSCAPMDPEEAIYSLEAVGHDFYVYRDKASGELRVMYKRQNGGYGVLIPHPFDKQTSKAPHNLTQLLITIQELDFRAPRQSGFDSYREHWQQRTRQQQWQPCICSTARAGH
ncbi:hypothetical protein OEZ85_005324 [Tetradesmus obliquus]|uniref:Sigma 54 modulation/S30EA ribosomal protein C-terminal domain-containing protein n=1 Tax=Tetradesmus obliquus TaxID=3088 RepID=A0ABY8UL02_TETOB|nr:hypothetical protein OEZ85_005324 [Tetradesmus obliquus]